MRIGRGTRMPLQGAVDVVPLHGAIVVCYGWGGHFFFTLITQKLFFAIWGLCWYNLFLVLLKSQTRLQTRYGITDFVLCNAVRQSDLKLAPTAGHSQEEFDIHP